MPSKSKIKKEKYLSEPILNLRSPHVQTCNKHTLSLNKIIIYWLPYIATYALFFGIQIIIKIIFENSLDVLYKAFESPDTINLLASLLLSEVVQACLKQNMFYKPRHYIKIILMWMFMIIGIGLYLAYVVVAKYDETNIFLSCRFTFNAIYAFIVVIFIAIGSCNNTAY